MSATPTAGGLSVANKIAATYNPEMTGEEITALAIAVDQRTGVAEIERLKSSLAAAEGRALLLQQQITELGSGLKASLEKDAARVELLRVVQLVVEADDRAELTKDLQSKIDQASDAPAQQLLLEALGAARRAWSTWGVAS